jgi:hypothetical protein
VAGSLENLEEGVDVSHLDPPVHEVLVRYLVWVMTVNGSLKAHKLLYHSTLGLRVMKKKKKSMDLVLN